MAIYQGAYYSQVFRLMQSDGVTPQNISGWTFTVQFRQHTESTTILLTATTATGEITVISAANGRLQLSLTKAQTALLPLGTVVTDFMRTDSVSIPVRYFGVKFKVKQPVTRGL